MAERILAVIDGGRPTSPSNGVAYHKRTYFGFAFARLCMPRDRRCLELYLDDEGLAELRAIDPREGAQTLWRTYLGGRGLRDT